MRKLLYLPVVFLFIFSIQSCKKKKIEIIDVNDGVETPETKDPKVIAFENYLQSEMDLQKIPAISVIIFKQDKLLSESYMGKSNLEQNIKLANNHLFLTGSISKVLTATALLQLYEYGHFDLNDNINDFLPFSVSVPNHATPITFKMLLTHTSGIADGSALDDQVFYDYDSPIPLDYFIENYLEPGGDFYNTSENFNGFEPGTHYEYSNIGSALMAVLVEQISSEDFNSYCKTHIFTPLGMNQSFWRLNESVQSNLPIVKPYKYVNNQYQALQQYTSTDYPNGGLRTTGRDLFKFFSALVNKGVSNQNHLLNENTIELMVTKQIPSINNKMGLHIFILNTPYNLWGHDGKAEGVSTIVAFNPITRIGAIILTNQGDANLDEILVESYNLGLKL